MAAAVTEDWAPVVENCDVSSWKEALVAAITHTTEDYPSLCESLGARLDPRLAQLCFLCSGNIEKLASAWLSVHKASTPENLQDLVEVIMLLKRSMELRGRSVTLSGQIGELLTRYGVILASEGYLEMALFYLESSQDEGVVFLRERIYQAAGLGGTQQQPAAQQLPAQRARPTYQQNQSSGYQQNSYANQTPYQNNRQQPNAYSTGPTNSYATNQPPPPAQEPAYNFNQNTQRQGSPSGGLPPRAKHVLDPSVTSGPAGFNSAPAPYNFQSNPPTPITYGQVAAPVNQSPYSVNQAAPFAPYNPMQATAPVAQQQQQPQQPPAASLFSHPPGWNDPPPINASRAPVSLLFN